MHVVVDRELSGKPSSAARRAVQRLLRWRDGHVTFTTGPGTLVLGVSGNRR